MTVGPTGRAVATSSRCCHPGITRARPGWCRGGSGWNGYRSGTHSTTHDRRRRHHDVGVPQGLGEDSGGHGYSHGTSICGIPRRCQPSVRTVTGVDRRCSDRTVCRTGGALRPRHAPPLRRRADGARCARRTREQGVRCTRRRRADGVRCARRRHVCRTPSPARDTPGSDGVSSGTPRLASTPASRHDHGGRETPPATGPEPCRRGRRGSGCYSARPYRRSPASPRPGTM